MPYIKIQTNKKVSDADAVRVARSASGFAAAELGKPEQYVMVAVEGNAIMTYAGTDEPAAYLEVKSIGLPESKVKPLSQAFCGFCAKELGVAPDRVFIRFEAPPGAWWGWNNGTF